VRCITKQWKIGCTFLCKQSLYGMPMLGCKLPLDESPGLLSASRQTHLD
jgi:hypothetical protein